MGQLALTQNSDVQVGERSTKFVIVGSRAGRKVDSVRLGLDRRVLGLCFEEVGELERCTSLRAVRVKNSLISWAISSNFDCDLEAKKMLKPAWASWIAKSRPMPAVAPVTTDAGLVVSAY